MAGQPRFWTGGRKEGREATIFTNHTLSSTGADMGNISSIPPASATASTLDEETNWWLEKTVKPVLFLWQPCECCMNPDWF